MECEILDCMLEAVFECPICGRNVCEEHWDEILEMCVKCSNYHMEEEEEDDFDIYTTWGVMH